MGAWARFLARIGYLWVLSWIWDNASSSRALTGMTAPGSETKQWFFARQAGIASLKCAYLNDANLFILQVRRAEPL